MNIEPIAFFHSPLTSKFGIPRQSGIVSELRGRIEFVPKYRNAESLRGLEDYDFLWIIWGFSENVKAEKHPTVRPSLRLIHGVARGALRPLLALRHISGSGGFLRGAAS